MSFPRKLLLLAALLAPAAAAAQDLEMRAHAQGRTLPPGYYARIARDPHFFEFRDSGLWLARTGPDGALAGRLPMLVINALFADSPNPPFGSDATQRVLFDGPSPGGTLTEFYHDLSGNRLTMTGQVLPWIRTGINHLAAVGTENGLGDDSRLGEWFADALAQADAQIDFGQFDNDGPDNLPNSGDDDGFVDAVVFQYLERAGSCGGPGVWPHRASISAWMADRQPYRSQDLRPNGLPIRVSNYITQSARNCTGDEPAYISVIAHEMGHIIGLPDLYHSVDGLQPAQRRWVLGCFSLMAAGSWGCGDGSTHGVVPRPVHMGPWEKIQKGWLQVLTLNLEGRQEFNLGPVNTTRQVIRINLRSAPDEYLLIEYRPRVGFDEGLPAGGVLVYRVDHGGELYPRQDPPRYGVTLLEADGDSALLRTAAKGGNRGVAGDMFTAGKTWILNEASRPSTRLATGETSGLRLNITVEGGQARIVVIDARSLISIDKLLQPFTGTGPALTAEERQRLDEVGNRNGRYDIGDLRAYIRNNPEAVPVGTKLPASLGGQTP